MPTAPKKYHPLGENGHALARRQRDKQYGTARQRGYDTAWDKVRKGFLHKHPLCVQCKSDGRIKAANVVDHIVPHRGNKELFWDRANWQALCATCHNRKTRRGE